MCRMCHFKYIFSNICVVYDRNNVNIRFINACVYGKKIEHSYSIKVRRYPMNVIRRLGQNYCHRRRFPDPPQSRRSEELLIVKWTEAMNYGLRNSIWENLGLKINHRWQRAVLIVSNMNTDGSLGFRKTNRRCDILSLTDNVSQ